MKISFDKIIKKIDIDFLKLVAIITMTLDHFSFIVLNDSTEFGTRIGRLAYPLFLIILTINFHYNSKDINKYIKRIFQLAIISQPFSFFAFSDFYRFNILFSLGLTLLIFKISKPFLERSVLNFISIICGFFTIYFIQLKIGLPYYFEYHYYGLMLGVSIYCSLLYKNLVFLILSMPLLFLINFNNDDFNMIMILLPIVILISMMTDNRFKFIRKYKLFFYLFYPSHLLLIKLVQIISN